MRRIALSALLLTVPPGAVRAATTTTIDCPPDTIPGLETANEVADIVLASPTRKAQLIAAALVGARGPGIHALLQAAIDAGEGPELVGRLASQTQLLERLMDASLEEELDTLPELGRDVDSAVLLAGAFAKEGGDLGQLALHRLVDVARREGFLDALLNALKERYPRDELVANAIRLAKPTRRPLIVAHRGGPPSTLAPENTLPTIEAGLRAGADALEIDLSLTKDGEIVLWHDATLGGTVNLARNLGLESGTPFRPIFPDILTHSRKPVHELDLETVRREYGYTNGDSRSPVRIPTLDEVVALASGHPELKLLVLDVKVPAGVPELPHRFAERLRETLEKHGFPPERVVLIHPDMEMAKTLKKELPGFTVAHDLENNTPIPSANGFDAGLTAERLGSELASVGLPLIGIDGRDAFLDGIARTRARIDAGLGTAERLMIWTVNDELTMRESIGVGVDAILTDDPAGLSRLIERLGL